MEPVYREALKLSEQGEPYVIATVVRTKGSTPQKAGAKLLIRKDGSGVGTLGGGCVEEISGSLPRRRCGTEPAPSIEITI